MKAPGSIENRDDDLKALYREVLSQGKKETTQPAAGNPLDLKDAKLIAKGTANYGQRFKKLWSGGNDEGKTPNQGDQGFCTMLSVLTRRNAKEIDRLLRLSGRMRKKWDEPHYADGRTYGEVTIEKAISGGKETNETPQRVNMAAPYHHTDVGNGQRLVALHGQKLRYCTPWGSWYQWNGKRWVLDKTDQVVRLAKETALSIYAEVAATADEHVRRELVKHANRSES